MCLLQCLSTLRSSVGHGTSMSQEILLFVCLLKEAKRCCDVKSSIVLVDMIIEQRILNLGHHNVDWRLFGDNQTNHYHVSGYLGTHHIGHGNTWAPTLFYPLSSQYDVRLRVPVSFTQARVELKINFQRLFPNNWKQSNSPRTSDPGTA